MSHLNCMAFLNRVLAKKGQRNYPMFLRNRNGKQQALLAIFVLFMLHTSAPSASASAAIELISPPLKEDVANTRSDAHVAQRESFPAVQITTGQYEGRSHFIVTTSSATYYYDEAGGALSRMIDLDGNDWINFKMNPFDQFPESAAASYRGLPNLVFGSTESGAGHPGYNLCTSVVVGNNTIVSTSLSGDWEWQWTFYDDRAVVEMLKVPANESYWFLYEGPPGGRFKPDEQYFGTSTGGPRFEQLDRYQNQEVYETWQWAYIGDQSLNRVLFLKQQGQADTNLDTFGFLGNSTQGINSQDGMVVFGFGRNGTQPLLTDLSTFEIGFWESAVVNTTEHNNIANYLNDPIASGSLFSDDFASTTLNSGWRFYDPVGDVTFTLTGSNAEFAIPENSNHDLWKGSNNRAPRLLQQVDNTDLGIEGKFEAVVSVQYQLNGIMAQEDNDTFVYTGVYHDGRSPNVIAAYIDGSNVNVFSNQPPSGGITPRYFRLERTGDQWTARYSADGITWLESSTFTQPLSLTEVGFYGGNAGPNPAYLASIDYFMDLDNPIVDTDTQNPSPPNLDIWYGNNQSFGQLGNPQQVVNILGNVKDIHGVQSLTYSVNGGTAQNLTIGPDEARLQNRGDFNAEVDRALLNEGNNTVVVTAVDLLGFVATETITVNYSGNNIWPLPYSVDWTTVNSIPDVGQIVDGHWQLTPGGLRPVEIGYDRLINMGEQNGSNVFEATIAFQIHSGLSESGIGVAFGWQGHEGTSQPKAEWPLEGIGWVTDFPNSPKLEITTYPFSNEVTQSRPEIQTDVSYTLKVRSEPLNGNTKRFYVKLWETSASEPASWDIQADIPRRDGSVLLIGHRADVTFENISIQPTGNTPPSFISAPITSGTEGSVYTYNVTTNDADGDPVQITAPTLPSWLNLTDNGNGTATLTGTPGSSNVGPNDVVLEVDDNTFTTQQSFTITVNAQGSNTAPTFTSTPVTSGTDGQTYTYNVTATDGDNDLLQFSDPAVPSWLTLTDNGNGTATLTGTPSAANVGNNAVVLAVSDGTATVQQSFTIAVGAGGPSPLFSDTFSSTTLDSRWRFFDPVGDVSLSMTGSNAELVIPSGVDHDLWKGSGNRAPRLLQPANNVDFGIEVKFETAPSLQYQIQGLAVQENDGKLLRMGTYYNGSDLLLFAALLDGNSASVFHNAAPANGDIPRYLRVERVGNNWTFQYSTDGSTWVEVTTFAQTLTVTEVGFYGGNAGPNPAFTASADYFMDLANPVTDTDGGSGGNTPPVFTSSPVTTANDGQTYIYSVTATDGDNDPLQFSDPTVPAWLTLTDNGNGSATLSGTPTVADVGNHAVVLAVSDGTATVQQSFSITVEAGGPASLFSDTFSSTTLDSRWRFFDPVGDVSLSLTGSNAELGVPSGATHDLWKGSGNKAPRLLQPVTNIDFGIEVKFESIPELQYQIQGVIVQEDDGKLLRMGTYHNGSDLLLFAALLDGNSASVFHNAAPAGGDIPAYLRVERVGNNWTYQYSIDGSTWVQVTTFTQALVVTEVGFYGGNAGSNPAFTASADYFMDLANPVTDTDGGSSGNTPPAFTSTTRDNGY